MMRTVWPDNRCYLSLIQSDSVYKIAKTVHTMPFYDNTITMKMYDTCTASVPTIKCHWRCCGRRMKNENYLWTIFELSIFLLLGEWSWKRKTCFLDRVILFCCSWCCLLLWLVMLLWHYRLMRLTWDETWNVNAALSEMPQHWW